jgi:hypothetical protein
MTSRALLIACLLVWSAAASAQRVVYKSVDEAGNISYSDRRSGNVDAPVKNWSPSYLSGPAYDSAVLRAESDRLYYARLLAERRQPVPVVIYDPRGWQAARSPAIAPAGGIPWRARNRWDPYLPATPAPGLDRSYYYNGR